MFRKFILFFFASSFAFGQISMTNHGGGGGNSGSNPPAADRGPAAFECPAGGCGGGGSSTGGQAPHDMDQYYVSPFTPPPYQPSQQLKDLSTAATYLKQQVQRRNAVRESIKGMDQYQTRHEVVEMASGALRVSREHYLADDLEGGSIASEAADILLDLATSLTPGISWGRDIYEAITGRDLHSGADLSAFSHGMAILGASTLGLGNRAFRAIDPMGRALKTVGIFEKLSLSMPRPARDASEEAIKKFKDARNLLYQKSVTEIKKTIDFFKKYKIYKATDELGVSVTNAFLKGAEVKILKEDLHVIRYHPSPQTARGSWVTTKELPNPHEQLALPNSMPLTKTEFIIPKGTEILDGTAAPQIINKGEYNQFTREGGGYQILVDKMALIEKR